MNGNDVATRFTSWTCSTRYAEQYVDAVNWAAEQDWFTGNVGLAGRSYHSMTQPPVAVRKPPALKCLLMGRSDTTTTGIREGQFVPTARHLFPVVPGWEGSGVVEQVGFAVRDFEPGRPVYGFFGHDYILDGAYAE